MKDRRYEYLVDIIKVVEPKSILEIGVAMGRSAQLMLKATGPDVRYIGYDVFDFSDKEFHKMVSNGKNVAGIEEIRAKLAPLCKDVELIKGTTQDTLHGRSVCADFVFLDGDHRVDAIRDDFEAVMDSPVVVFDDYYDGNFRGIDINEFGCNLVVEDLDVILTPATKESDVLKFAIWVQDPVLREKVRRVVEG